MKKLLFIIISTCLFLCSLAQIPADSIPSIMVGSVTGQKELPDKVITFNIGSAIPYINKGGSSIQLQVGFPYNALYIEKTFLGDMFVSKGYYPDVIQLRWKIQNNANLIDRFEIFRKKVGGGDSIWVKNLTPESRGWEDEFAEANVVYQYTVHAIGIPGEPVEGYSFTTGVGFRTPLATVTGRVTFPAGTGVGGVTLTAGTQDNIPASGLQFSNLGYVSIPETDLAIKDSFTFQAYVKFDGTSTDFGIFEKSPSYRLTYESQIFVFQVGNDTVQFKKSMDGSEFVHISCVYDGDSAYIYIPDKTLDKFGNIKDTVLTQSADVTSTLTDQVGGISLGLANNLNLTGYIDEVRIWDRALETDEIKLDFNRYISGKENGILGYWRMNEGFGMQIYDISKNDTEYNENHGEFVGESVFWTNTNYPTQEQLGYKAYTDLEGNYLIAGIPFVTGGSAYKIVPMFAPHEFDPEYKILFLNEDVPVVNNIDFIDVSVVPVTLEVLYDNTTFPVKDVMVKVDGNVITDSNNQIVKTNELGVVTFEVPFGNHYLSFERPNHLFNMPHYPGVDSLGNILRFNFNEPKLIRITDTTKVKLAGKVAGGPVEADKNLGSDVNPGIANIGRAEIILTTVKKGVTLENGKDTIRILTNEDTGEYERWVLPEMWVPKMNVKTITGSYEFDGFDDLTTIDLSNKFFLYSESDSVFIMEDGKEKFDKIDTCAQYHMRRDWIYRSEPDFTVKNEKGQDVFGAVEYVYKDSLGEETIPLIYDDGGTLKYSFGKPVFLATKKYQLKISAFEEYVNNDGPIPISSTVPVTDGKIKIINNCANILKNVEIPLNASGELKYKFTGDAPKVVAPFTNTFSVDLITEKGPKKWGPVEAYNFGDLSTGSNFTTDGPTYVDFILRDPPGSNSSSTLEKGSVLTTTTTHTVTNSQDIGGYLNLDIGPVITTEAGTPFFATELEIDVTAEIDLTLESTFTQGKGRTDVTSVTFNESFSTSDDPDFVGRDGDVFIGHSSNIIYGISKKMGIFPKNKVPKGTRIDSTANYIIALGEGLMLDLVPETYFIYSQRVIEEEIIPGLEKIRDLGPADSVGIYNTRINNWKENVLKLNEEQKINATPYPKHQNISFGAGSVYESSITNDTTDITTTTSSSEVNFEIALSQGIKVNGLGFVLQRKLGFSKLTEDSDETEETESITYGFTLSDQDPHNILTVDIKECPSGINGPIFKTLGGQTSCPYEGADTAKYFEPTQNHELAVATMKIDGPLISVENAVSPIVPETSPALYTVYLDNTSEAEKDNWYIIGVDLASNENGAKVMMDGSTINEGIAVFVPYGEQVVKTIEVYKGLPYIDEYEDLAIYLSSQCDDISSEIQISAYFASACSPVEFLSPGQGWLVNFYNKDLLKIKVGNYNLQHDGFEDIFFQYTPSGTSNWITAHTFCNYPLGLDTVNKTQILGEEVEFIWNLTSLADRAYDLRLVTQCSDGSLNFSEVLSGILDGQLPQIFGTPQPADGILNVDENISVRFNEPIEGGLLNNTYFNLKGSLNNYPIDHSAFIRLNGNSDHGMIPEGISFNDKSFTIEFWIKPNGYPNSVIFSQGNDPQKSVEIGIVDGTKTYFKLGNQYYETPFQFTAVVPADAWQHLGYVFDYENSDVLIYQNDKILLEERSQPINVNNSGKLYIGKSSVSGDSFFAGDFHELRIWSKVKLQGEFYADQYKALSGNEVGLYGYWPMNEAFGELAVDKAAYRHMEVFAPWVVDPGGAAWDFSGNNYLELFTGYFAIIPEMDYTIEFWFKDKTLTDTVCLFSNQKGDGNDGVDLLDDAISIFASPDGKIWVASQGNIFEATYNNYFDNQWHHFALVLRRRGNVVSFIDGIAQNERENSILGGISGGKMYLGIRKWDNVKGIGEDWSFSGKIDEFRLWNLAKTRTQISMDMCSKLHGNEIGLMAYLPFEGYIENVFGEMVLENSLKNNVLDINASNAIPNVGLTYTQDAPNVKDARPVEDVAFDFVASEDQIIIMPKTYMLPQLEKNIIEITVERVQDKYENQMASPVTWTAYVHRNQVRWEDERRLFTKEIYKSMSFVSSIKNTGGQQVGFTLTNLPPWLTAFPSSGTINPESTLEIEFFINPALNIGEYNEDIILHTENEFDEKLPITVRVYKTPPDWKVTPSDFEHTMNMVGRIRIEGVLSTDMFDKVAVFKKNTDSIRGVANLRYIKDFDSYLVFLNVYGNVIGEELEFRIWDASAGQILDNVSPFDVLFAANGTVGTTIDPVIFEAVGLYRQYIPLARGWNWVSFNKLASNQNDLNAFFASVEADFNDQIKTKTGFSQFEQGIGWNEFSGIDSIDNLQMYQMKISSWDTMIYSGENLIPEDNPIPLNEGWNHIGYIPDLSMDVNDALRLFVADTSDIIKSQYEFSMFDPRAGWLGTLEVMRPSYGYMFKVRNAGTLTYPNTTIFKGVKIPQSTTPPLGWGNDLSQYRDNLSIIAKLNVDNTPEVTINNQMVLGAFINKENRGFVAPLINTGIGYEPFFLNVSNNESGQWISFMVYDGLTGNSYSVEEKRPFVSDAVYGSTQNPLMLTLKSVITGIGDMDNEFMFDCYPNPFNESINIEFTGTADKVTIDVLNANGAVVKQIYSSYPALGSNQTIWDGRNGHGAEVSSGVYYVRFISGDKVETVKISKNR